MRGTLLVKRLVSFFVATMIFMSLVSTVTFADSYSDAKNSVVVVIRGDGLGLGSGFAIGKVGKPIEYIVTNNHVVHGDWGFTTATVAFDLASNNMTIANIYYYNADKDIAILKLPQPTEEREALALCPMEDVDLDGTFAALGYPGDQYTDWPQYNMNDITITKGGIKKADRVLGLDVYMLDLTITNGNSGGPLVNSDGEVVGINTFGINNDNYAIAIDELLAVIDTDKIPISMHGDINWLLIVGLILVLIIVALVIILVVRRSISKKTPENLTIPVAPNSDFPLTEAAPTPTPERAVVRVIAVGGALNGRKYSVGSSAKIGRDSSKCQIVFPVNTKGVSGLHCEIAFDGSVCYLKDLNSSYGTFTVDGSKLKPNVPLVLKTGDKFYLASPDNTFEVRF